MKLKRILLIIISLFLIPVICFSAEVTSGKKLPEYGWEKELVSSLNLTQSTFDHWIQGGENTLAWQLNVNTRFENEQGNYNWANTGKIAYGKSKVGDAESRKTADEIKLETVLTYKLSLYVNPYVAFKGETQFTTGYAYTDTSKRAISDFFDPAYFTQSLGLGYSPGKEFKTRLGFALKETFTDNYPIPYADDPDTPEIEKTKVEAGMDLVVEFKKKLAENILFSSKLDSFSNLKRFDTIDVNWDNLFSAKVSKIISANYNFTLLYDKDLSKKRQIKQILALTLTLSFL
ncbi:MAG: DUF3078 domain-containing protein [candidate division Zixibacteria bacterium]|nr:DUF3078 domain-containing protein [candidate division Zixibacteria bacterium]